MMEIETKEDPATTTSNCNTKESFLSFDSVSYSGAEFGEFVIGSDKTSNKETFQISIALINGKYSANAWNVTSTLFMRSPQFDTRNEAVKWLEDRLVYLVKCKIMNWNKDLASKLGANKKFYSELKKQFEAARKSK